MHIVSSKINDTLLHFSIIFKLSLNEDETETLVSIAQNGVDHCILNEFILFTEKNIEKNYFLLLRIVFPFRFELQICSEIQCCRL